MVIESTEASIAYELAKAYRDVAREAQHFEPSVNENRLPSGDSEAMTLARGIIEVLRDANKNGNLDDAYRTIIDLGKASKVPENETPTVKDMQIFIDGLLASHSNGI